MKPAALRSLSVSASFFVAALGVAALVGMIFLRWPAAAFVFALGLGVLGLALRHPDVAIYAVLFLLYSNLPAIGVAFHGVPKPLAAAFPLLLAVPLVRDLFVRRTPLVLTPALFLHVLLPVGRAVGAAFSIDTTRSFGGLGTFAIEGVILYLLVTNVLRWKETLLGASWAIVAAGVLMSIVPL